MTATRFTIGQSVLALQTWERALLVSGGRVVSIGEGIVCLVMDLNQRICFEKERDVFATKLEAFEEKCRRQQG